MKRAREVIEGSNGTDGRRPICEHCGRSYQFLGMGVYESSCECEHDAYLLNLRERQVEAMEKIASQLEILVVWAAASVKERRP